MSSKSALSKQEVLEKINQQFNAMHDIHNLIDGEGTPKSIKQQFNPLYKALYIPHDNNDYMHSSSIGSGGTIA